MGVCASGEAPPQGDLSGKVQPNATGSSSRAGEKAGAYNRVVSAKDVKQMYTFTKTLGKGGSCRVVEGYKSGDKSHLMAIKILSKQQKVNGMLFEHEVKILQKVKHDNIIKYLDSFADPENYYVLTQLCRGGELFDRIVQKDFQFTERMVSRLVKTMLLALKCCHERDIVHRDLKPENFVFVDKSKDSDMVLIDFGCAKVVKDETEYKDLVGTPYYLAPESANAKTKRYGKTLKASDVWSVGVIAYVMMTGRPPFNGKSNPDIFKAILRNDLKFPREANLSKTFRDFVTTTLKKEWRGRPNVQECLEHPWVKGEGTSDKEMNQEVLRCLVQFNNQSKLKKAITKCLSKNMGEQPRKKIEDHFRRLDKNGDGALSGEELQYLLMDLGYSKHTALEEANKIISESDQDGDGEIQFEEFATVWQRKLLSVNNKYANAVFKVLDHDGDGFIDASELKSVLGMDDDTAIDAMISEVDTNHDGKISLEEFKAAMKEDTKDFGLDDHAYGAGKIDSRIDGPAEHGLGTD